AAPRARPPRRARRRPADFARARRAPPPAGPACAPPRVAPPPSRAPERGLAYGRWSSRLLLGRRRAVLRSGRPALRRPGRRAAVRVAERVPPEQIGDVQGRLRAGD